MTYHRCSVTMDGMVAVVRGVGDAGLTVTLVDGDRHYTLMPSNGIRCQTQSLRQERRPSYRVVRDSSSQATDGQYATVYQLSHCCVSPTSPHEHLTEYPPQREAVRPGDDNFVVGGYLQGERHLRGNRGSPQRECPSHVNSFARSLRRHPSPEPASEVVERLVTYTHDRQDKVNRSPSRRPQSCKNNARSGIMETRPKRAEEPTRDRPGGDHRLNTYNIRRVDIQREHVHPKTATATSETQASVQTISREVSTTPRVEPFKKNVAIPVSPKSSHIHKELSSDTTPVELSQNLAKHTPKKSNTHSDTKQVEYKILCRKWKSLGDVRVKRDVYEEILNFLEEIVTYSKFAEKLFNETKKDLSKVRFDRREVFQDYIKKLKVFRTETNLNVSSFSLDNLHNLENTANSFNKVLNINKETRTLSVLDSLNFKDNSTKRRALRFFSYLLENPNEDDRFDPKNVTSMLLQQVNNIFEVPKEEIKADNPKEAKNEFIKKSLLKFFKEQKLCVRNNNIQEITKKVIKMCNNRDKNVDSINKIGKEIMALMELNYFTDNQAVRYTDLLLKQICSNVFEKPQIFPRNYLVFHNTQNSIQEFNDPANISISAVNQRDIGINLKFYTNQLVQIIEQWLTGFIASDQNEIFRQVAVNDLADDIVDRHKYLEMNPSKRKSDDDELEYLKFQIFKWIHDLIGDDNISEALDHADVLLQKIRSIPVPMLTIPQDPGYMNPIQSNFPPCCAPPTQQTNQLGPGTSTPRNTRAFSFSGSPSPVYPTAPNSTQGRNNGKYRRQSGPVTFAPGPMLQTVSSVGQIPKYGQSRRGGSLDYVQNNPYNMRRMSGPSSYPSGAFVANQTPNFNQMPSNNPNGDLYNNNWVGMTPVDNYPGPTNAMAFNMNQMPTVGQRRGSLVQQPTQTPMPGRRRMSGPAAFPSGPMNMSQSPAFNQSQNTQGYPNNGPINPCCVGMQNPNFPKQIPTQSMNQSLTETEDEFEQFVRNWVQQIPISSSNPQEQAIAEKARLGISNGIMIAVTKLKLEPTKFKDPVYCRDVLEDELDGLLGCLPQTEELSKAAPTLKPQMLEKANNLFLQAAKNYTSYKQQLVQSITNHMPRVMIDMQDPDRFYEDVIKMDIAEHFLLFINYVEEDKFKANIFMKKVANKTEELIEHMKNVHGIVLDANVIKNEVVAALTKVPLPSNEQMKDEVEEVLLGIDIEHWFTDLPLIEAENNVLDIIQQRRHRDVLTKKIHDLEKRVSTSSGAVDPQIKQEVMRFLQKLPLRVESTELNFMADELLNRLKNRNKDSVMQEKSVAFQNPQNYANFAQDLEHCSSYADGNQEEQSSYMIVGGTRHEGSYQQNIPYVAERRAYPPQPDAPVEWLSLFETECPEEFKINQSSQANQYPPSEQIANSRQEQSQRSQVQSFVQPNQMPPCCPQPSVSHQSQMNTSQPPVYQQTPQQMQQQGYLTPQQPLQASQIYAQLPNVADQTPMQPRNFMASTPQPGTSMVNIQKPFSGSVSLPVSQAQMTPGFHSSLMAGPSDQVYTQQRPVQMRPRQLVPEATGSPLQDPRTMMQGTGYITPQNSGVPTLPQLGKQSRPVDRQRVMNARKMEMEENEDDFRCRCMERGAGGRKKRSVCYDMEEFPFERCMPVRFYPCFY